MKTSPQNLELLQEHLNIVILADLEEEKTVTCLFTERSEKFELTKVYVVEFGCELIFCKSDNHFLVND
ncbi:hypothetical protein [Nostoc sp.]